MSTDETAITPVTDRNHAPRQYIRIRPTADSLTPETVYQQLRHLYRLTRKAARRRWYHRLGLGSPTPPVIECLLVSDGRDDTDIQYYLGIDDDRSFDPFERILRVLFPDTYEFERVVWHPDHLLVPQHDEAEDDPIIAGVEFRSLAERHDDWQTGLTPFLEGDGERERRVPLAAMVETMTATPVPMVYQVLLRPKPNWSGKAELRRRDLEGNRDTILNYTKHRFGTSSTETPPETHPENQLRIEELDAKNPYECFEVNARAVAIAPFEADAETAGMAIDELATALAPIGKSSYQIDGKVASPKKAATVFDRIRERTFRSKTSIPSLLAVWNPTARSTIVADPVEAPNFCLLDGTALTTTGRRSIAPTTGERTTLPRPPIEQLPFYRGAGLTLGRPRTQDGVPDHEPVVLPRDLQALHAAWFGKTGSGKSMALVNAILDNHTVTDGADILIEPKGGGMAVDYLRAHYARFGHLDNVLYFDCAEVLPAFSFFDIRDELAAGVPSTTAIEDKVDHYVEILIQIMGRERFEQAVRSPDVIKYLIKAGFDPINGAEAFSHRELHAAARRMHERQAAPAVSDTDLEQALGGIVANRARTFDEIMAGVANRLEKIPVDRRLARIFNHVPGEDDPHLDLADYLDENVVIIFDTGGLRSEAQRVLTLVILSNLWTALRRRVQRGRDDAEHPLVNLYIEEAASVAVSDLLKTLLAQARGFDCSVTLSMQFPAQLRTLDEGAYGEVLNNISTFVTGNVPVDHRLAERLATDDMDAQAVANRIRALSRGEWLVKLPAGFGDLEPRPFVIESMPLPPGHPEGDHPLSRSDRRLFEVAFELAQDRTLATSGLTLGTPSGVKDSEEMSSEVDSDTPQVRVDSALPHTKRLPETVEYDAPIHALRCTKCDNRYDPSIDGMIRAIECCSSLDAVDPVDVPICDLNLKLAPEEIAASEWSVTQLLFLQAVYNAQQLRYRPLEYDLLYDSMLRLQEYVGIDTDAVEALIDVDLLRHDTDHPHRLYTVTPEGRKAIGESYRQGVDYGHGAGDLEESSEHVFAVEVARQYLERAYAQDPESPVVEVQPYYELDEQRRLDLAGLDSDGEVVVAVEAERVNHDIRRAAPEDFDKMASVNPEEAIWIVMSQSAGHDVLEALNEPLDGNPRVEKTYAKTTPPQQFRIDTPGLTAIYPAEYVRDTLSADLD